MRKAIEQMMAKLKTEARVATLLPARYMAQLCKHFGHKIPASYTADSGRIEFESGFCTLQVESGVLVLRGESDDEASLARLEIVVARHLERFMWRETPQIAWIRPA
jgi:uncharacterized protein